ncbi:Phox-like protein [Phanerochaete sordida]|uniref:Endosomal/vacuolar adapter protein YPT35 n=1 Tax=Phanerochaete sordida TaxID=48140 RepID=A0A9P3G700_9APHY|nr:Phox-like protein [Phanerochaete sordida]
MIEVLPDGIDVEEEARLYEELCDSPVEPASDSELSGSNPRSRRRRTRPESLFSHEPSIWLSDNTNSPTSPTPTFARNVQISGWTLVGDRSNAGAYVVFDCAITLKDGTVVHAHKRYSAFAELDALLREMLPPRMRRAVPKLPPKSPLSKFRAAFLDKRRRDLQHWLASVILHPDLGGREVVRHWVMESS